jgi:hypothetical protein
MSLIAAAPDSSRRSTLRTLTAREVARMAASPLLLIIVAVAAAALVAALRHPLTDPDGMAGTVGSLLGGFSLITAFGLTTSTQRSESSLAVTPTSSSTRTAALCLSTLVPLSAGLLTFFAVVIFQRAGGPAYGVLSSSDRTLMLLSQLVLPTLGGPLLGIALARWFPQPWVPVAAFLTMIAWILIIEGIASSQPNATISVWLRLFAPFALFVSSNTGGAVQTWRGSAGWFVGWQLALCLLAITVALLRDATPAARQRLRLGLAAVVVAAACCYVLAALGGLQHAVVTDPSGHTAPL